MRPRGHGASGPRGLEELLDRFVAFQLGGAVFTPLVVTFVTFVLLKVLLTLKKPKGQEEAPFLVFHAAHLGTNAKVRRYDTCATTFIKKISVRCLEFKGQRSVPGGDPAVTRCSLLPVLTLRLCSRRRRRAAEPRQLLGGARRRAAQSAVPQGDH